MSPLSAKAVEKIRTPIINMAIVLLCGFIVFLFVATDWLGYDKADTGDQEYSQEALKCWETKYGTEILTRSSVKDVSCSQEDAIHGHYPVRFVYHALPRTGSTRLREQLRKYCDENGMKCLRYKNPENVKECMLNMLFSDKEGELGIIFAQQQRHIMDDCEPYDLDMSYDGVIDYLTPAEERYTKFLDEQFPRQTHDNSNNLATPVRFTIIREPLSQFIAYVDYYIKGLSKLEGRQNSELIRWDDGVRRGVLLAHNSITRRMRTRRQFNLEQLIAKFYNISQNPSNVDASAVDWMLYNTITNAQSKELGWKEIDGDTAHEEVLSYVSELNCVGIASRMPISWRMIKQLLGIEPNSEMFEQHEKIQPVSDKKVRRISSDSRMHLRHIQRYDIKLYETATQLFQQQCSKGGHATKQECTIADFAIHKEL